MEECARGHPAQLGAASLPSPRQSAAERVEPAMERALRCARQPSDEGRLGAGNDPGGHALSQAAGG